MQLDDPTDNLGMNQKAIPEVIVEVANEE